MELFLIAVGLAMDAFAVSICRGLAMKEMDKKLVFTLAAFFGGFQALMPLVGYFLGSFFADVITKYSHWIAFALLAFLGAKMIKESFESEELDEALVQVFCSPCYYLHLYLRPCDFQMEINHID